MNDGLCLDGPNKGNYVESDGETINWMMPPKDDHRAVESAGRARGTTFKTMTYRKEFYGNSVGDRWYCWSKITKP